MDQQSGEEPYLERSKGQCSIHVVNVGLTVKNTSKNVWPTKNKEGSMKSCNQQSEKIEKSTRKKRKKLVITYIFKCGQKKQKKLQKDPQRRMPKVYTYYMTLDKHK